MLGGLYGYRAGSAFRAAWRRLEDSVPRSNPFFQRLPYASLATGLRVLSSDFVRIAEAAERREADQYWITSRRPLSRELLTKAFLAWEFAILPEDASGILADAAEDLKEEQVGISDFVRRRTDGCPNAPSFVWDAARWEVAHRLARAPLALHGHDPVPLRIDSEAALLTWSSPVEVKTKSEQVARELHRIELKLITVPGLSDPVIHLQSRVVRLTDRWNGLVKSAWIDVNQEMPLLLARLYNRKTADGWRNEWADATADMLGRLEVQITKDPHSIDLRTSTSVRARMKHSWSGNALGTGPGQMFHDSVAFHACRQLSGAEPVELVKAKKSIPRDRRRDDAQDVNAAIAVNGLQRLRIVAIYSSAETRKRMHDALGVVLKRDLGSLGDGELMVFGSLEVVFLNPPAASSLLLHKSDPNSIRGLLNSLCSWTAGQPQVAALIETLPSESLLEKGTDPKFALRQLLASQGMVSQFLSPTSAPAPPKGKKERAKDHAALHAVRDLLRSAGVFAVPFPLVPGRIEAGTWLVGAYVVHRNGSGYDRGFVASMVAVRAGTAEALGLAPDGRWMPLGAATAAFHAREHDTDKRGAAAAIESALTCLKAKDPRASMIVFMDAAGCRRFWAGLKDTSDRAELPKAVTSCEVALVRVRADEAEVPRPAGRGHGMSSAFHGP